MSGSSNSGYFKKYCKDIRLLFPTYGKTEKAFMSKLTADIEDFIDANPSCDYLAITSRFGEPKTVVGNYLLDLDDKYLAKRIKTSRYIKICICLVIFLALLAAGIKIALDIKGYKDAKDAYIGSIESVIEEIE